MSYDKSFQLVRISLIEYCKECVSKNWKKCFDMWLIHAADMEFGHCYQNKFKEHFGDDITPEIATQLWFDGKHVVYAIKAFMFMKKECELNDLLEYVEKFISEQLDDFDNNYDTTVWNSNSFDETLVVL